MLHQVKCTNCGANIDNAGTDRFIKCEYCGSSFGNFTPFGEFDIVASRVEHNDSDTLKLLALSFKMKDYDDVLKLSDRLLEKNLCDWIALTYKGIALFWLGYDNFFHLDDILKLLSKAKTLSNNNEFVLNAIDNIANDTIIFAAKNEIVGKDLENSLRAINTSKQLTKLRDESVTCMTNYCTRAFDQYKMNFEHLIKRDKKNFDPPITALRNIYEIAILTNDQTILESFYLYATFHLSKNGTKSYFNDLSDKLATVENILKGMHSQILGKKIQFTNFLEKMIIK